MSQTRSRASDPRTRYVERHAARSAWEKNLSRREAWIANLRLVAFLAAVVLGWISFVSKLISPLWVTVPLVGFVFLVVLHDRVIQRRRRAARAVDFYQGGLARLDNRWIGTGNGGNRFRDMDHPYAEDLDLFGEGSVFELLCTARTPWGESSLAEWLLHPASASGIRERQAAVEELRDQIDLREDLAVLGTEVRTRTDPDHLLRWCVSPGSKRSRTLLLLGRFLSAVFFASVLGSILLHAGLVVPLGAAFLQLVLALQTHSRTARVVKRVDRPGRDLSILSLVLARLEVSPFRGELLKRLQESLRTEGQPPSKRIAQLVRLVEMQEWSRNYLFAPIAILLNWDAEFAHAITMWRHRYGPAVAGWVETVGEIEALVSLAGHAFEHPSDPFPEIVDDSVCFDGTGIGHPLLPESRCVRNDLRLDPSRRLLIVSGSNMSGKSTLLRTVGVNAVLALAGAPVRAASLKISFLAVGASIRSHDSLHDGTSRFYEEIKRMRRLVDIATGGDPLLFLIDEILHGTNSHDRRIGTEAIARGLIDRGGIGLITTHDLALTRLADDLAPHAVNVHFSDELIDGRMVFDYRIHPGVVEKSNAIALMRSIGLDV